MTRKRFIKLLMSKGVQRNDVEKYARECIEIVKDYEYLYVFALEELIEQILKVSLINLNRNFGFGQQRLLKFVDTVTEMFEEHREDELYWYHVDKILKEELKIDMEGLNELDK